MHACSKCTNAPRHRVHLERDALYHHKDIPNLCSIFSDVDSLAPHEQRGLSRERSPEIFWMSDEELRGVLKPALPRPSGQSKHSRLFFPLTPEELELRLHQALTHSPLPSLSRLISYHNIHSSLQSAASYNFLVQFAIRHTSYATAFQLFRRMEARQIKPNNGSKILFVRLLVRTGQWYRAWIFARQELSSGDKKATLLLWLELLGRSKQEEFNSSSRELTRDKEKVENERSEGSTRSRALRIHFFQTAPTDWTSHVLSTLSSFPPSKAQPPDRFIYMIVRHLLQDSRAEIARAVTMEWISRLPDRLSRLQKRRCLNVLHLHLAYSPFNTKAHFANRKFVKVFLERQPHLRPSSTTLFLLLRNLAGARVKPTFHALQLTFAFRKKWGTIMIDRRVRRRIVNIALQEGRVKTARKWLAAEVRESVTREALHVQRHAVGEQNVKLPWRIRRMAFSRLMLGTSVENRKWRWTKRRLWRRENNVSNKVRSSVDRDEGMVRNNVVV